MAGHLGKLLYDVPHVVTAHSLEPQRPWKAEQLGGGYRVSLVGRAHGVRGGRRGRRGEQRDARRTSSTAYPALDPSRVHVIHNGIDTDFYRPDPDTDVLERLGVDLDRPYVAFVGRITRQKGVPHLLRAGLQLDPSIAARAARRRRGHPRAQGRDRRGDRRRCGRARDGVFVVSEMLPREEVRQVLTARAGRSAARRSTSRWASSTSRRWPARPPSWPAASAASPRWSSTARPGCWSTSTPADPDGLRAAVRRGGQRGRDGPGPAGRLGQAGRARAVEEFGWDAVALRTVAVYEEALR